VGPFELFSRELGHIGKLHQIADRPGAGDFNPGDPIQQSFNFDIDISERQQPPDYPDTPSDDGQPS
jgi:hypothetical protein